ncbi:MAG: type III pantothenate kinase, partial [Planctomycetota bacterium]
FDGDSLVAAARLANPAADPATALGFDASVIDASTIDVSGAERAAVSVNDPLLEAFLSGSGRGTPVLGRDLPLLMENRYRDPSETGHDRLAAAAAAHEDAGGAAVIVDLGSAVTVDAVDGDGVFLGGAIAPGRPALVAGLAAAAPGLPPPGAAEPAPGLPASTEDAIRVGIDHGLAGIVTRLVGDAREETGAATPVFLTGGDAASVAPRLPFETTIRPHLVLDGVRILYARARA